MKFKTESNVVKNYSLFEIIQIKPKFYIEYS